MSRIHISISLCILTIFSVNAQKSNALRNIEYEGIFTHHNPMMLTSQPAAIYTNSIDSISLFSVEYHGEEGDFKPTMMGTSEQTMQLKTNSTRRIGQTMLGGTFQYNKGIEKENQYTNMYNAYRNTPYLFIDSIGGDNYTREAFSFEAQIATPITESIVLGSTVDYRVGLGAQNKDPRSQNKMVELAIKQGLVYTLTPQFKLGAQLNYAYYNEDIDIMTVKPNESYFIFNLTGLGTYSKHESSTFYRLYQNHHLGSNIQIETGINILELAYDQYHETAKDGRKDGGASWAAVKEDSRLAGHNISINNISTFKKNNLIHQVNIMADYHQRIGTEITQQLKQVDDNSSTYQWHTVSEEDKYTKNTIEASINYELAKYTNKTSRDYSILASIHLFNFDEKYHFPNLDQQLTNIDITLAANKLWSWKQHRIDTKIEGGVSRNIMAQSHYESTTFINDMIISPDFHYFSANKEVISLQFIYDYPLYNKRVFTKVNYKEIFSDTHRRTWQVALGIIL